MVTSNHCHTCSTRIPKNCPKLVCCLCNLVKHFKCQKLSKNEAQHIIASDSDWICKECISEILPINICGTSDVPKFKAKCSACNGYSYSQNNTRTCNWCSEIVHVKCFKPSLGCIKCCEEIIPGFHVTTYELYDDYSTLNNLTYNPYHRSHVTNLIGDTITNEEHHNSTWSKISEFLVKCQYKQQKHVQPATPSQLKIFSMNIRSLTKHIEQIRENIGTYEKYDILCLNETNCIFSKLPNGMNDIILEGFYEPFLRDPVRSSGRGGGLAMYINRRVTDLDKIESFEPNPDPTNISGEFQFVKLHNCKGYNRTKIIGNVYRSPNRSVDKFPPLLDSILQKLERHSRKHITLVGDFNIDLIKHSNDLHCQNLIDTMSNYGFVQLVSRPTRITDHSQTLIDHSYSNQLEDTISCNVLTTSISDHLATMTTINLDNTATSPYRTAIRLQRDPEQCVTRKINEANHQTFKELIDQENWDSVFQDGLDAQGQFDKFCDIYTNHYNTAYPLKSQYTRRKNERVDPKPWILP